MSVAPTRPRQAISALEKYEAMLDVDARKGLRALDFDRWSDVVDMWNKLADTDRKQVRKQCSTEGHWWVSTPIDAQMCRRCLEYAKD